jgi:hypothetical protein
VFSFALRPLRPLRALREKFPFSRKGRKGRPEEYCDNRHVPEPMEKGLNSHDKIYNPQVRNCPYLRGDGFLRDSGDRVQSVD